MKIPFSRVPMAGNELNFVKEVLESGWLTTSTKALQFERLFAEYLGVRYACAVNSCTAALHLAVEAVGIKAGDKVLVPTMTFTATADVVRYLGADPVFTDVEYGTCLLTPEILQAALAINGNVRAVMPVHYGGQAASLATPEGNGIVDICRSRQIRVVEDAAHAFPTKFQGRFVGSFGDVTCFSFYANKTITTGEGGMLVTNDEAIYNRVKTMRLHGIDHDVWDRYTNGKTSWEYDIVAPGYKYNMPDINAAVGLAQLGKADFFREQRQRCALYYLNELQNLSVVDLPLCVGPVENHAWHLFPIIIKPDAPVSRNEFIHRMSQQGIGTSVHYKPLHRMSYYRDTYQLNEKDFPNAERIWQGIVSLPIYPDLTDAELKYICAAIRNILS
ncbi:DegT/DnrJ/EryC1/StrS family aminotransferase [Gaoshiqia sediminis]|uniref:DegT/DnrJ/EryC1/StrS family aminotransferase n=1 Tax=Gaoshiqia sediminis TaxID=2986998 RepID=A0AA42C5L2_9BACT|nr:DegT/DnrJ/EryC1/StrS family aminotransferase [Gaoshiqia sediminis]MCW0481669.1 DegT/DnrJ/EryC1/StrS family aminotransferase [Gaoshiqia sediminis]